MIEVGQKVKFDPFWDISAYGITEISRKVIGTVVEVHEDHKWFSVEYNEPKLRTSFNFADIGLAVKVIG